MNAAALETDLFEQSVQMSRSDTWTFVRYECQFQLEPQSVDLGNQYEIKNVVKFKQTNQKIRLAL